MTKIILLAIALLALTGCGGMTEPLTPTMVPIRPDGTSCTKAMNDMNYTGDALGYIELFANGRPENRQQVRDSFESLIPPRCAMMFESHTVAWMDAELSGASDTEITQWLLAMNSELERILEQGVTPDAGA